jgi:hypothetical protein
MFSRWTRRIIPSVLLCVAAMLHAGDWPQWRGPNRDAVWHETGILQSFPPEGLKVPGAFRRALVFQVPSSRKAGSMSPIRTSRAPCSKNVRCWMAQRAVDLEPQLRRSLPGDGADPDHSFGPVVTPVVADGRITHGRMSDLCLDAVTGRVLWHHELPKEFGTKEDLRGPNCSPIVESNVVIIAIAESEISIRLRQRFRPPVWEALDDPSNTSPIVIDLLAADISSLGQQVSRRSIPSPAAFSGARTLPPQETTPSRRRCGKTTCCCWMA